MSDNPTPDQANLRPSQRAVLAYERGRMGIAAVPGAGKTFTLSRLAAQLVEGLAQAGSLDDREVLIVTLTNSAVNAFRRKIATLLRQERGLLPYTGYRVRTLHSLAADIVRMRPDLASLPEDFQIADERTTAMIIRDLAEAWTRREGERLMGYMDIGGQVDSDEQLSYAIRKQAPPLIEELTREAIKHIKDSRWAAEDVRTALARTPAPLPLAEIAFSLYEDYERALRYRGLVDYDDLIRRAMEALEADGGFLGRLRRRWPFILEDEAQDSSKLQNDMLRLLAEGGGWVRVGDPNQSIFTTFTTADSNLLRGFLGEDGVLDRPLRESGRSALPIIDLANYLVRWTQTSPLVPRPVKATFYDQQIVPTPPGDGQPNPPPGLVHVDWQPGKTITPDEEVRRVVASLERWLPDHQDWTAAVLVPDNSRGFKIVEALHEKNIPHEELLRSTLATRDAARYLQTAAAFIADPLSSRAVSELYTNVWWPLRHHFAPEDTAEAENIRARLGDLLSRLTTPEDFLWPGPEGDWLNEHEPNLGMEWTADLVQFRLQAQVWASAADLPVDQLVLTLGQDMFTNQADLALAHKLAVALRRPAEASPDYRLLGLANELRTIAENERRFLGFEEETVGFEPRPGVVTVATMHAAKGLEWDRVYLMAVNNYSFPLGLDGDSYQDEKWFIRENLNLKAETRAQLELTMSGQPRTYQEGVASRAARYDYAAERLRLLYVGITRARRDLILTWNMGRFWDQGRQNTPSAALQALRHYLEGGGV